MATKKVLRKKYFFRGLGLFEKGSEPTPDLKKHPKFSDKLLIEVVTKEAKPKAKPKPKPE
jgi:hypothetical protein